MKLLNKIKDGIKMVKDKTVINIGTILKSKANRVITGILLVGFGGSLIVSGYIKLPE